jgi:hypothetical protein
MSFRTATQASFAAALCGLAASIMWQAAVAQTPPSGQLKCHVEGGMSFIVGSSRQVDCI